MTENRNGMRYMRRQENIRRYKCKFNTRTCSLETTLTPPTKRSWHLFLATWQIRTNIFSFAASNYTLCNVCRSTFNDHTVQKILLLNWMTCATLWQTPKWTKKSAKSSRLYRSRSDKYTPYPALDSHHGCCCLLVFVASTIMQCWLWGGLVKK